MYVVYNKLFISGSVFHCSHDNRLLVKTTAMTVSLKCSVWMNMIMCSYSPHLTFAGLATILTLALNKYTGVLRSVLSV